MSLESARSFYRRLATDETFREAIQGAPDAEQRMEIIRAAEFDFDQAELEEVTLELGDPSRIGAVLSAEDQEVFGFALSSALGGGLNQPYMVMRYGMPSVGPFFGSATPVNLLEIRKSAAGG